MSYCVNCGVELHESEPKCPLCGTVVLNPNAAFDGSAKPVFPRQKIEDDMLSDNRRITAWIMSIVMAIPVTICLITDFGISGLPLTWSVIVSIVMALVWCLSVPPVMLRHSGFASFIVIDTAALLVFLYLLSRIIPSEKAWFMPLGLPIVLSVCALVSVNLAVIRISNLRSLYVTSVVFVTVGAFVVALEVITDIYIDSAVSLYWSLIVMAPCALLALLFVFIEHKRRLKDELKRRLYM